MNTFCKVQKENNTQNVQEFTALCYKEFYASIVTTIYSKCGRKQLAEDIVQETFIKFIKALKEGQKMDFKSAEKIKAYLLMIAHNTLKNYWQSKANKIQELKPIYDSPIPNQAKEIAFKRDWEKVWFKEFTPQEQKMYTLMSDGYAIKEIAEMLNIKPNTLSAKINRDRAKKSRKKLRNKIKKE